MHGSVIYGLIGPYGQWHGKAFSTRLCWWTDCPELGAHFLKRSDEESRMLCKAIEQRLGVDLSSIKPLKQEIIEAYDDQIRDHGTMLSVLRTNQIEEGVLILDGPDIVTLPTMSFRTMMPRLPVPVPFIKLPVALWLTSEQRSLQAKSIHMGPRVSTVIKQILADENGFDQTLEIFPEEVALHYKHAVRQEDRPGRHLSVAYRASKDAFERTDGLFPITVAALLTRSPARGRPLITELIEHDGAPAAAQAVEAWFRRYARVVTHPVIGIYLLYGIALEAHQQNTSVLFAADGTPRSLLIRDFGDGRTYAPLLAERGHEIKPYVHPGILPTVFSEDIEPVRAFVLDACFVCHLHEIALLLTEEYGLAQSRLWQFLREETARTFDAFAPRVSGALWQAERVASLEHPWPTRSVLRMHLLKYSDYRLQHHLPNPLLPARNEG
ncbi:IucA/IucC family C-terminal-domain containing protein [Paraburkholderia sp. SIMBA_030]|uniref:IucA/IucC family C-terminal-domain containing protein n=1 Tax=Paraburkholderia sp. SIMBA_030 TaxID=3085773 RepID=UPI00397A33A7